MGKSTCVVEGCDQDDTAPRGWCWSHYNKWRRHGSETWQFKQVPCSVDECTAPSRVKGMCDKHYRRVKVHGDPAIGRPVYGATCGLQGCDMPVHQTGKCSRHYYEHWVTAGNGKASMAARSAARRAREAEATADRNLSWVTLWREGETACYLCGEACNEKDFDYGRDRVGRPHKYCGPTHPSLDHVIPLAKGGAHRRSNVRMACLRCNRAKHVKVIDETKYRAAG